jgi:hypothetical protein
MQTHCRPVALDTPRPDWTAHGGEAADGEKLAGETTSSGLSTLNQNRQ